MPTYEEGEASFNVTSDYHIENPNPTEYDHPQTFEEGEYGVWTASNFTNNEPEVINSTNNKQFFFASYFTCNKNISTTRVSFTGRYLSIPSTTGLIAWLW
jgi:hypothetical protein